jgi:hypothetical protein
VPPLAILGLAAIATVLPAGLAGPLAKGPHGFSEILYAFTSAAGNNGSAFGGLSGITPFYNILLAVAMLIGRFGVLLPALAIAGGLAAKRHVPTGPGSFPTTGPLWVGLLVSVILIVGGLTFLPSLARLTHHLLSVIDHNQYTRVRHQLMGNWDIFLNVINVEAQAGVSEERLCSVLYGGEEEYRRHEFELSGTFYIHILRPLCWAGLLQAHRTGKRFMKSEVYTKTPLWAAALRLETDRHLQEPTRH